MAQYVRSLIETQEPVYRNGDSGKGVYISSLMFWSKGPYVVDSTYVPGRLSFVSEVLVDLTFGHTRVPCRLPVNPVIHGLDGSRPLLPLLCLVSERYIGIIITKETFQRTVNAVSKKVDKLFVNNVQTMHKFNSYLCTIHTLDTGPRLLRF